VGDIRIVRIGLEAEAVFERDGECQDKVDCCAMSESVHGAGAGEYEAETRGEIHTVWLVCHLSPGRPLARRCVSRNSGQGCAIARSKSPKLYDRRNI
jgi:hypothetical protein